jgi:hypothetical protein
VRDPRSPIVVVQEGCAPDAQVPKTKLFYLQRDGQWIDEIARSTRPDNEAGNIIFETTGEALKLLSSLFGKSKVRDLPVTEADTQAYVAKMKSVTSPEEAYREFLTRYRASKGK